MAEEGRNPFTPSFGVSPPLLVGRDGDVEAFIEALEEGPGSPYRATLFTGQRGSGKTVLLNALEDRALARGWVVLSETARPGLAQEMTRTSLPAQLRSFPEAFDSAITAGSVSVAGVGAALTRERTEQFPVVEPSLRHSLRALADAVDRRGGGVFITVDEVSADALADLQVLTQAVQHAFREGRQVVFAAAGLPAQIQHLLQAPGTTFLRRAERAHLGAVPIAEVARAIAEPMHHAGRTIGDQALQVTAQGTQGYPFMVQLVGFQAWRASRGHDEVSVDHAAQAVAAAARRVGNLVHGPALAALSPVDRTFLAAMAPDPGPSKMADITERMDVDANYAGQYRRRLIEAEIIHSPARGYVDYSLPYLRDHLREHATHDLLYTETGFGAQVVPQSQPPRRSASRERERRTPPNPEPPASRGPSR